MEANEDEEEEEEEEDEAEADEDGILLLSLAIIFKKKLVSKKSEISIFLRFKNYVLITIRRRKRRRTGKRW